MDFYAPPRGGHLFETARARLPPAAPPPHGAVCLSESLGQPLYVDGRLTAVWLGANTAVSPEPSMRTLM
jgi:hypothetical protein